MLWYTRQLFYDRLTILFQRVKPYFFKTSFLTIYNNLLLNKPQYWEVFEPWFLDYWNETCYLSMSNINNTFLKRLASPCVCLARMYQAFFRHSQTLRGYRERICGNMKMKGRRDGRMAVLRGMREAQPPPVGKPTSTTSNHCVSLLMPSTS